jgi:hypothetical protein
MECVLNSLEELGFIECSLEPERHVETIRVIFFASTPVSKRQERYYCKMIRHIVMNLYKKNIRYDHIKIDWSPELFVFIPAHGFYSRRKETLFYHVREPRS